MRYLILVIFLVSCGGEIPREPDGCKANAEIERVETKTFCTESIRCVNDGDVSFSNYMCFCDNICLCFFSVLTNCESVFGNSCDSNSSMLLMGGETCLQPNKRTLLEDLYNKTQEIMEDAKDSS